MKGALTDAFIRSRMAQAIVLGVFVLTSGAHAEPRIITVPTVPAKPCSLSSDRPNLTSTERRAWYDLCALFNDEDRADRTLEHLKKSAREANLDFASHADTFIKLYRALERERAR